MITDFIFSPCHRAALLEHHLGRWRAGFYFTLNRLLARPTQLDRFDDLRPALLPEPRYLGHQSIALAQITGSVARSADFDRRFRPRKSSLRQRWISIHQLARTVGCLPIQLYQVGERYFISDGHHRVSVARASGASTIHAEIWQFQPVP
jgi:hypothetical protein